MNKYYVRRALEILQEQGLVALCKNFRWFMVKKTPKKLNKVKIRSKQRVRYYYYYIQYGGSIPDPNKIIKIHPGEIEYTLTQKYGWAPLSDDLIKLKQEKGYLHSDVSRYRGEYVILGSDWDIRKVLMKDVYHVRGLIERYVENKDWTETSEYNWHKQLGRDEEMIKKHFRKCERLYDSIQKTGFDSKYPVKLTIGRGGELMRVSGHHRITISSILGLKNIPAKVTIRHKQWQEFRDEVHKNGLPEDREDLRNHPDLQDILN